MLSLQKEEKRRPQNTNRRGFYMGAIALVLLLVLGGGFYYYLQTLDQTQMVVMTPPPVQAPQAVAPATPLVTETPEAVLESEPVAAPPAASGTEVPPAATEEEKAKLVASAQKDNGVTETIDKPVSTTQKTRKPQASASGDNPMKVARMRKSEPTTNPTQVAAYQAFLAGDDQAAGRIYRQLLQSDPRNIDALLGLAAVASRQDKVDEAVRTYQHALELDPRNSIAQAGLITMLGQSNPSEAESQLKNLLAQQPDAAYLHAALGNTYSELNRWPEAQQSYFQAFSMDSSSADYAFNLAVSLDQLGKYDLALDYYQKTSTLLDKQGGSVDRTALDNRVGQLRNSLGK
jgi:tetratricopeptide (TPR) repeat protein